LRILRDQAEWLFLTLEAFGTLFARFTRLKYKVELRGFVVFLLLRCWFGIPWRWESTALWLLVAVSLYRLDCITMLFFVLLFGPRRVLYW
jgi:hypothetical protein